MENVQFPVSSAAFLKGVIAQSSHLSLEELISAFTRMAGKSGNRKESRIRCSLKTGDKGVVFLIGKGDLISSLAALSTFVGADLRSKFCKRLVKSITDHRSFFEGVNETSPSPEVELSFSLEVATGELTGIKFNQIDRKILVNLKKKILENMLGEATKGGEKGRPIGANLRAGDLGLFVEVSQEQAVALLRRSLPKLSAEQLMALDSRLGGAITSFPEDRPT